ncbi:MAG: single-stranded DNA-binding protein [Bacteroidales bacterium]|nr:single-stranded DNA-binding protein [Bacteroidales bacterium]
MEQFNRIEVQGLVGNVRITNFEESTIANISVATNYIYKGRDGQGVVETMWFTVIAREGKSIENAASIKKGNAVHAVGRMRTRTFTDSNGNEKEALEIIATKVEKVDQEEAVSV